MKKLNMKKKDVKKKERKNFLLQNVFHKNKQTDLRKNQYLLRFFQIIFLGCLVAIAIIIIKKEEDNTAIAVQQIALESEKQEVVTDFSPPLAGITTMFVQIKKEAMTSYEKPEILDEYKSLYETNSDMIGWLYIPDTKINYPVMQTMGDEDYYLSYDFYKKKNINGSLLLDTDSNVGIGTRKNAYAGGNPPTTNLIIHGHTMKSGEMFGNLKFYKDETYGKEHNIISFDSLYEKREYELISVFYSQVFYQNQDVFKYYKFFQANTKEEFQDWYDNIKAMSLYDTGVRAEFGDEFITLSCCSYQVEDGRFVVVAKRIK